MWGRAEISVRPHLLISGEFFMRLKQILWFAALIAVFTFGIHTGTSALSHTKLTVGGSTSPLSAPITGFNSGDFTFETDWALRIICDEADSNGNVFPGTEIAAAAVIGEFTGGVFDNCMMTGGLPFKLTMSPGANPKVEVEVHPANAGDPIDISITDVDLHLHNMGTPPWACEARATGNLNGTLSPSTSGNNGVLTIKPGFALELQALDGTNSNTPSPSGATCVSQIYTDDLLETTGTLLLDTNGAGDISHS